MTGCMSYYLDDKKLKKYALFKNTVDNATTLVYYLTSTEVQIHRNKYHIADMFRKSNTKEEVCDGI